MNRAPRNPDGKNGVDNGSWPLDDDLNQALRGYARERLDRKSQLAALLETFGLSIGYTKLWELQKKFGIVTPRTYNTRRDCSETRSRQLVVNTLELNPGGTKGPLAIATILAKNETPLPMQAIQYETPRGKLYAIGPFHEVHGDGHEKISAKALQMGPVGLDIYGMRDKWSGCILHLVVVPNSRLEVSVAHIYLDFVEKYEGIPLQLTLDKGSETGLMREIQLHLRATFAPDLSLESYPAAVTMKSTHNVVIEQFWRWLRKDCGINLFEAITAGRLLGVFNPGNPLHVNLFNWLWPPIVQAELDEFAEYWNMHRIRHQKKKLMPSGVSPNQLWRFPEVYGSRHLKIPISNISETVSELRGNLSIPRSECTRWVSDEFTLLANAAYEQLGSPSVTPQTAWAVFVAMLPFLQD